MNLRELDIRGVLAHLAKAGGAVRIHLRREDPPASDGDAEWKIPEGKPLPAVPRGRGEELLDHYWLLPGYSSAAIIRQGRSGCMYRIIEPVIDESEYCLLQDVHEYIRDVTLFDEPKKEGEMRLEFGDVRRVIRVFDSKISGDRINVLYYYLKRTFEGYGRLDPLMRDDHLEDISCSGPSLPVYVFHRRYGNLPTTLSFQADELNHMVLKLAQKAGKQISLTTPLVDAALPDGSRAQLTFSDTISPKGSSFTIRKFRREPMTPLHLIDYGTYDPDILAMVWLAVENRMNIMVVGGTASGKTSTLNAISLFIPAEAKIVSIEDTREIQLPHRNWLPMQTREVSLHTTAADIDMFSLLRASLRQRPEFLLVGEVRGREAQTLFQAMNTGHTTFSTFHAGSVAEAVNRLVNEPINVPPAMFGALDLVLVQSSHHRGGRNIRRCDSVHEIFVDRSGTIRWETLFEWDPVTDRFRRIEEDPVKLQKICRINGWSREELEQQLNFRSLLLRLAVQRSPHDLGSMMEMISEVRGVER
ncbi:MAG: type II/IV secretion system ATPase subunit [Methanoculleaceae archaeon]